MANNNKKGMVARLQRWMDSVAGQTFLNYAYSWGAAVVILGTLFKLTHISGADIMLFVGMGTEVFVFFISGFDRPSGLKEEEEAADAEVHEQPVVTGGAAQGGATVIVGGGFQPTETGVAGQPGGAVVAGPIDLSGLAGLSAAQNDILRAAQETHNPEMEEAMQAYVDRLKELTQALGKVSEQASRLSYDSAEMENLNRTLTGINTIYEMQLRSISTQIGTIDQINEQTRKMASQIEELNRVYSRMIEALTVNMRNASGGTV
ncbi:MAG: gliding motility protein GldL [Paraprevotella sp.]|nr:gliding motility protein GldL [Paraprevotella sp.]